MVIYLSILPDRICVVDGRQAIYCHFENQDADFFKIASTGTRFALGSKRRYAAFLFFHLATAPPICYNITKYGF